MSDRLEWTDWVEQTGGHIMRRLLWSVLLFIFTVIWQMDAHGVR